MSPLTMEEFQVRNLRRVSNASDTTLIDYSIEGNCDGETSSLEDTGETLSGIENENATPPATHFRRRAPPNIVPSEHIYTVANESAKRESKKPKVAHFALPGPNSPLSESSESSASTMTGDPGDPFNPSDITYIPTIRFSKPLFPKSGTLLASERHAAIERVKVINGFLKTDQDRREMIRLHLERTDLFREVDYLECQIFAMSEKGKADFMVKFRKLGGGGGDMQVIEGVEINEVELKREAEEKKQRKKLVYKY